jgi:quercetin dioxygenase-like cupin family protein
MSAAFEPTAVDLRDYVAFDLRGASGRRVFVTDVVAVDLVCLEPSQAVEPRTFATADAIYTVLGGRAWVVTDEAEVTLDPLQSVMIPAEVPHALRNDSPDPLILQVVISPPDEAPAVSVAPAAETEEGPSVLDRLRRALGG